MDVGTAEAMWSAIIHLYRAGELHQAALERLNRSAPVDAQNEVAPMLAEAGEALYDAFRIFRIKPVSPDAPDSGDDA